MRSMLFVPGDSARKFERASQGAADALILDLEDSVAPDRKLTGRAETRAMLDARRRPEQLLFVRVNALDTGLTLGDLAAAMPGRPDGIVLPKSAGGSDVARVAAWLDAFEAASGIEAGSVRILPIVTETGASMFGLGSYGGAPRLAGLMWGAEDLAASLGATENGSGGTFHSPYRLARDLCLMAAAAAEVMAVDTVYTDIDNLSGLEVETRTARRDGFGAKAVIHPKHVDVVNAALAPTEVERAFAEKVVTAFADAPGLGVVRIDGRMIDKPHLRAARRVLGLAV